ncbi:MAG: NFACT RNA binding domain-containing protein [Ethanoligenens sp.]
MALDGAFLSFIAAEIGVLVGARVDKVQQPEKDELNLTFRQKGGGAKLLLSSSADHPRAHLTAQNKENPMTAPMFCMLLRKHLGGAKLHAVRQPGLERQLYLDFDCRDDLGDEVQKTLSVEIMGRHSNIIFIGPDGKIIDAIKHIDFTMSSKRQVLPGLPYTPPPAQDKVDLLMQTPVDALQRVLGQSGSLEKAMLKGVQGVSPLVCRELCEQVAGDMTVDINTLGDTGRGRLLAVFTALQERLRSHTGEPTLLTDVQTGRPLEFSFMRIMQYGDRALTRRMETFSALLDAFYTERDRVLRVSQRAHDMLQVVEHAAQRIGRKLERQRTELATSEDREALKQRGDLVSANLYQLKKGMSVCSLADFYHDDALVEIALDVRLTPAQNAQKFYKAYHKAAAAERFLTEQIAEGEEELRYLETVLDEISRAGGESELAEIREELIGGGYLRRRGKKREKLRENAPRHFVSDDGFEILIGRNNKQNDRLTLKTAAKTDMWFHTKNIPGAHVIVLADGREVPERTLTQAAVLAATHSKAKDSAQVPVDYAPVRRVKKPVGAKPGMVIYEGYNTAYVQPDEALAARLEE